MNAERRIASLIGNLVFRLEEVERRLANIMRPGTVTEVDAEKGLVKVDTGGLVSPWLPWVEQAGRIKTWSPPSVGQQVHLMSPSGEAGQGWAMNAGFSDANPQGHDRENEWKIEIGAASILFTGGGLTIAADAIRFEGASLSHNGKNVGDDHKHKDVVPGGALSGVPA